MFMANLDPVLAPELPFFGTPGLHLPGRAALLRLLLLDALHGCPAQWRVTPTRSLEEGGAGGLQVRLVFSYFHALGKDGHVIMTG